MVSPKITKNTPKFTMCVHRNVGKFVGYAAISLMKLSDL